MNFVQTYIKSNRLNAFVLAGGKSKDLGSISDPRINRHALPKPAVPVGPMRAIDYSLRSLAQIGVKNADILTGHLSPKLRLWYDRPSPFDIDLNFSPEVEQRHTLGAVLTELSYKGRLRNDDVSLVLYGDIAHNLNLHPAIEEHLRVNSDVTVVLYPPIRESTSRSAKLILENMPLAEQLKPGRDVTEARHAWIIENQKCAHRIIKMAKRQEDFQFDSGLAMFSVFIFRQGFLKEIQPCATNFDGEKLFSGGSLSSLPNFYGFGDIFKWLTSTPVGRRKNFFAYIAGSDVYRRDIGTPQSLQQANFDVLDGRLDAGIDIFSHPATPREQRIYIGHNTYVSPGAEIIGPTLISDNVIVEAGARISNSVIREGNIIREGAIVENSVLFPFDYNQLANNVIGKKAQLTNIVFTGGEVDEGAIYFHQIVYTPVGGCAVDNL